MRLVFMGTPEAAVPTLKRCVEGGHEIVAVWTQPDRPAGRGHKLTPSPVKEYALGHNLPVYQFAKIKTAEAEQLFSAHRTDAAIVVAYGRILPPSFLRAPRAGCINVHFSLLPKYRGAAPVNWAIVRGERETGVTTMQMDEGLDTGPIYLQRATEIGDETAAQVIDRLALLGAELLCETLERLDDLTPRVQVSDEATFAPLLRREDGRINWNQAAVEIERAVRGFQPWPNAHTEYDGRRVIIWRAHAQDEALLPPENIYAHGEIVEARGESLVVACGGGTALSIRELQPETKRRMSARDFLNGAQPRAGEKFL
ncbi:MAG: methionyl-tRNA formyltransferase [Pyrinomonadaceae bacterium]